MRATIQHDSKYFYADGDFLIQVEETLFCIHSFLLKRNTSTLADLFVVADGGTSQVPKLRLSDDTCEEFRALCWVLYALPHETRAQDHDTSDNLPKSSISRLLSLALISNKYNFKEFETWSRNLLDRYCLGSFPYVCSQHDMKRLVRYYTQVEAPEAKIRNILRLAILTTIDDFVPPSPQPASVEMEKPRPNRTESTCRLDTVQMLNLAETYGWRRLQGDIYYRILRNAVASCHRLAPNTAIFSSADLLSRVPTELTIAQRDDLVQGYISLTHKWENISRLFNVETCAAENDPICICTGWRFLRCSSLQLLCNSLIGGASQKCDSVDIAGRLAFMREELKKSASSSPFVMRTACQKALDDKLSRLEIKVEKELAGHFLGSSTNSEDYKS